MRVVSVFGVTVSWVLSLALSAAGASTLPAGASSPPLAAVINGCKIVANPTPSVYTRCPGKDLSGADLSRFDLSYANFSRANLSGATFATCSQTGTEPAPPFPDPPYYRPVVSCLASNLTGANLARADLSSVTFADCEFVPSAFSGPGLDLLFGAGCGAATVTDASLLYANASGAVLVGCITSPPAPMPACGSETQMYVNGPDKSQVDLTGSNLTRSTLVPQDIVTSTTDRAGTGVDYQVPVSAETCNPPPGSMFPIGRTTVTCSLYGGSGTFYVRVRLSHG